MFVLRGSWLLNTLFIHRRHFTILSFCFLVVFFCLSPPPGTLFACKVLSWRLPLGEPKLRQRLPGNQLQPFGKAEIPF